MTPPRSRGRDQYSRRAQRSSREIRKRIRQFLKNAGISTSVENAWERLSRDFGPEQFERIDQAIADRAEGRDVDIYPLIWSSLELAKTTYAFAAPTSIAWLTLLSSRDNLGSRLLDIGCGFGVHACFWAQDQSDRRVVGIDRSPYAVQWSQGLSEELKLSNVAFRRMDLEDLHLSDLEPFDAVTGSFVLRDGFKEAFEPAHRDPWSMIATCRQALQECRFPPLEGIAAILVDGGKYHGLERMPSTVNTAAWLGALLSAGLQPVNLHTLTSKFDGEEQSFAEVTAIRQTKTDVEAAWIATKEWFWQKQSEEEHLSKYPPVRRHAGCELAVLDDSGFGQTRFECLELESGEIANVMTTSRGLRDMALRPMSERANAIGAVEEWCATVASNSEVMSSRLLEDDPWPQSRPDLL